MKPERIPKATRLTIAMSGIIVMFLLWSFITYTGLIKPFFLPTPGTVARSIIRLFQEFGLVKDIGISVYRILLGFGLGCMVAIPLGLLIGTSKKSAAFFDPIIGFIRYIPPAAFVPLFILWFGIGNLEKVLLIFAGVTPLLTLLVFDVVSNTSKEIVQAALTLGARPKDVIFKVVIPQALPGIWDAMRIMLAAAWTYVVLAEIVASTSGLGHLIIISQRFLRTANVIAAILIIGILGLLTDYFFKFTYKIFFPWTEKSSHA